MEMLTGFYERLAEQQENRKRPFRIQRHITRELMVSVGESLREAISSDPALAARNLSNQHSGATAWLRAVPTKSSLRMTEPEFRQGLQFFCGIGPGRAGALPESAKCKCGTPVSDPLSKLPHMLSCKHLGWRIGRHDALVDDIFQC